MTPKLSNIIPKLSQMTTKWSQMTPKWSQMIPKWSQMIPRWSQMTPKVSQMTQNGPKLLWHGPKWLWNGRNWYQVGAVDLWSCYKKHVCLINIHTWITQAMFPRIPPLHVRINSRHSPNGCIMEGTRSTSDTWHVLLPWWVQFISW